LPADERPPGLELERMTDRGADALPPCPAARELVGEIARLPFGLGRNLRVCRDERPVSQKHLEIGLDVLVPGVDVGEDAAESMLAGLAEAVAPG
jgi:hypothetical protein